MATAWNHSLDFGVDGVDSTIDALRTRRIAFRGVKTYVRPATLSEVVQIADPANQRLSIQRA